MDHLERHDSQMTDASFKSVLPHGHTQKFTYDNRPYYIKIFNHDLQFYDENNTLLTELSSSSGILSVDFGTDHERWMTFCEVTGYDKYAFYWLCDLSILTCKDAYLDEEDDGIYLLEEKRGGWYTTFTSYDSIVDFEKETVTLNEKNRSFEDIKNWIQTSI